MSVIMPFFIAYIRHLLETVACQGVELHPVVTEALRQAILPEREEQVATALKTWKVKVTGGLSLL